MEPGQPQSPRRVATPEPAVFARFFIHPSSFLIRPLRLWEIHSYFFIFFYARMYPDVPGDWTDGGCHEARGEQPADAGSGDPAYRG